MEGVKLSLPPPDVMAAANLLAADDCVSTALGANVSILHSLSATAAGSSPSAGEMLSPVTFSEQSYNSKSKEADIFLHIRPDLPCIAGKRPGSSSSCSKRPRTCHGENCTVAGIDADCGSSRRARQNVAKCTSGLYGLKLDAQNATKHVDDILLSKLLDGSYKHANLCQDKGKKVVDTNESIVCSVIKACSILLHHNAVESQNNADVDTVFGRRKHAVQSNTDSCLSGRTSHDSEDNCEADLASTTKGPVIPSASPSLSDLPLYQPQDISERLVLPPSNDLDTLLRKASALAFPSRSHGYVVHSGTRMSKKASIPPFAWSLSLGGHFKGNIDSGKLFANRNVCQTKWVRLGSASTSPGNATNWFSDLMLCDEDSGVPSKEMKIDMHDTEHARPCTSPASDDVPLDNAQRSLKHDRNEPIPVASSFNSLAKENANISTVIEQTEKIMDRGADGLSCHLLSSCTTGGSDQSLLHLPSSGNSKQVVLSPRILLAAQILCDLASHSRLMGKHGQKLRWPKNPSLNIMKTDKMRSLRKPQGISVTLEPVAKAVHAGKNSEHMPFARRKLSLDKKKNHINGQGIHQGSMKWSVPLTGRYPDSPQGDIISSKRHWSVDPIKLVGLLASPPSSEKACGSQQRPRKTVLVSPVFNHDKDGCRVRSKKE